MMIYKQNSAFINPKKKRVYKQQTSETLQNQFGAYGRIALHKPDTFPEEMVWNWRVAFLVSIRCKKNDGKKWKAMRRL